MSVEESNLFCVAMANRLGQLRASWRILGSILQRIPIGGRKSLCRALREKVESEHDQACQECIDLIDDHLLPTSEHDLEAKTYFLKR